VKVTLDANVKSALGILMGTGHDDYLRIDALLLDYFMTSFHYQLRSREEWRPVEMRHKFAGLGVCWWSDRSFC